MVQHNLVLQLKYYNIGPSLLTVAEYTCDSYQNLPQCNIQLGEAFGPNAQCDILNVDFKPK